MSELRSKIETMLDSYQGCYLATVTASGSPEASATPYLLHNEKVYILVSELASHTQNLRSNALCSVIIGDDEAKTGNIFARRRLIFEGSAQFISRESGQFETTLNEFEKARGATVGLLKRLPDFHLVEISPSGGSYIEGFGAAYSFSGLNFSEAQQQTGR